MLRLPPLIFCPNRPLVCWRAGRWQPQTATPHHITALLTAGHCGLASLPTHPTPPPRAGVFYSLSYNFIVLLLTHLSVCLAEPSCAELRRSLWWWWFIQQYMYCCSHECFSSCPVFGLLSHFCGHHKRLAAATLHLVSKVVSIHTDCRYCPMFTHCPSSAAHACVWWLAALRALLFTLFVVFCCVLVCFALHVQSVMLVI